MPIRFFLILFFSSAVVYSCQTKSNSFQPKDPTTIKFNAYLNVNFGDSIPTDRHLYILISENDSKENISIITKRISREIKTKQVTTIISSKIQLPDSSFAHGFSHVDWDNAIGKLKMNLSGVTLIQTEKQQIVEILALTVDSTGIENQFLKW